MAGSRTNWLPLTLLVAATLLSIAACYSVSILEGAVPVVYGEER